MCIGLLDYFIMTKYLKKQINLIKIQIKHLLNSIVNNNIYINNIIIYMYLILRF